MRFPVAKPDLTGNEQRYAAEAIASSWISSTGPFIDRFESEFAVKCGTKYAVSVCNGTAALHLALLALDVRPGDEVIVPDLTYVAVANAVRYVGAEPVFVDVDEGNWCLNPALIERSITRRTRGIIAVHSYGHPADMDAINSIAAVHGLWVVEDAAEAHFAKYHFRPVGGLGRIGVFSFYGNKIITCGEGGVVTTSDAQLDVRLRTLRGQGVDPARRYYFPVVGHNFRMTNVAAAILCAQLERATEIVAQRKRVCDRYRATLGDRITPWGIFKVAQVSTWVTPAPWMFSMLVDPEKRDAFAMMLENASIETRPFFVPLHKLPPYRQQSGPRDYVPVTCRLAKAGINLPTYSQLSDDDVDEICSHILMEG